MWPLQSESGVCGVNEWATGDWHNCVFEPVPAIIGDGAFGLVVGAGVFLAFYLAGGGRMPAPTAITIILATFLFPLLPGSLGSIAWAVLFIGGTAAAVQAAQKYVLNPTTT
jgi:hypothetical protein